MELSDQLRVLLVDDNDAMLARAGSVLASDCTVVGTAKDGPAALEAADLLRPDVIVLDVSLPGMTGFEIATRLRQEGSTAAVVFLTVHDGEEFVEAASAAGGLGYVVKTRLMSDLRHAVQEARAGRRFVSTTH